MTSSAAGRFGIRVALCFLATFVSATPSFAEQAQRLGATTNLGLFFYGDTGRLPVRLDSSGEWHMVHVESLPFAMWFNGSLDGIPIRICASVDSQPLIGTINSTKGKPCFSENSRTAASPLEKEHNVNLLRYGNGKAHNFIDYWRRVERTGRTGIQFAAVTNRKGKQQILQGIVHLIVWTDWNKDNSLATDELDYVALEMDIDHKKRDISSD